MRLLQVNPQVLGIQTLPWALKQACHSSPIDHKNKSMETTWSDTVSPGLSRSFDPIKIKWQLLTDGTRGEGPGKRSGHAMSVVNGGIFLFGGGGVEENTFLDSLWVYDTAGHRYIILHFPLSPPPSLSWRCPCLSWAWVD